MKGLQTRHPFPTIALHWIGAALVVALAATGYAMTRLALGDPGQFALYQLHKTLGVAALLLAVARLAAAAAQRQPRWAMRRRDRGARAVQAALLALALVVPMSGCALVSSSRLDMPILLAGLVEFPRIESLRAISPEAKSLVEPRLSTMHAALAWALVALAAAHALAALHRHFVLGDKVLRRMLPVLAAASVAAMSPAAATTWIVDPARSTLGFAGLETGNRFAGRFARWSADVSFDPAQPEGMRVRVVVEVGSAATGDGRRDALMLGDDWLDASGFPRARFEATGARALDAGRYEARGTLALRDRIRPVAIEFTLEVADGEARARHGEHPAHGIRGRQGDVVGHPVGGARGPRLLRPRRAPGALTRSPQGRWHGPARGSRGARSGLASRHLDEGELDGRQGRAAHAGRGARGFRDADLRGRGLRRRGGRARVALPRCGQPHRP